MFRGAGTIVNILAILLGSGLGIFFGSRFTDRTRTLVTDALGVITLISAADAIKRIWDFQFLAQVPRGWTTLGTLLALVLGAIIGSSLRLEDRLEQFGLRLKGTFGNHERGSFIEGFMAASLLFAIGPLAILGSISDGMGLGTQQLALKSSLDFFASIAFASTFGWGVLASIIPVAIYQFAWTGIGFGLGNIMQPYQVDAMTVAGGVLLFGISLRLLGIKQMRVGDLLPAIFIAPLVALVAHSFI